MNRRSRLRSQVMIDRRTRGALYAAAAMIAALGAAGAASDGSADRIGAGREIAHDFEKGNCLACHSAPRDHRAVTLANIAPPLVMMRERYPDRSVLREQIRDPAARNPDTIMPPYARHRILTDEEIELIIDYLYTL